MKKLNHPNIIRCHGDLGELCHLCLPNLEQASGINVLWFINFYSDYLNQYSLLRFIDENSGLGLLCQSSGSNLLLGCEKNTYEGRYFMSLTFGCTAALFLAVCARGAWKKTMRFCEQTTAIRGKDTWGVPSGTMIQNANWSVVWICFFHIFHHPNWLVFFRGVGSTTNQTYRLSIDYP